MFEKEVKFIIDFTLNRIRKLGSFFTFEKLVSAEIHPAIILYISAHLDYLIYEDRKNLLQNSAFDYSGSEIAKYFRLISEEIKKNKRLAFEDVKTLITHAVTFNINYLVRPNWTLSKLIFDENKNRNVNEIKMMLNYLYYYDYVRNVFLGYFSKRKILSLSEAEFEMILGKVDQQMFGEHTTDLIDNALVSIGEFFNEGGVNKTQIASQTIESFLKEKNLMEALFKLRRAIPADDKQKYDIEDIRKILYLKESPSAEHEREEMPRPIKTKPAASEQLRKEQIPVEDKTKKESTIEKSETSDSGINLQEIKLEDEKIVEDSRSIIDSGAPDDFMRRYEAELKSLEELEAQLITPGEDDEVSPPEPEQEEKNKPEEHQESEKGESLTFEEIMLEKPETNPAPSQSEQEPSDELIIEEEEVNPFEDIRGKKQPELKASEKKGKDIFTYLSDKEMEKIITNVFNEDEDDFANTMEKIAESGTYDDATEVLKLVFLSYKVNPYSRDAVTLTNAVSNYFDQDK